MTLMQRDGKYRWRRNDGEWVSPTFDTLENAQAIAGKVPFLTESEWAGHSANASSTPTSNQE
jgi:hypothetical protein